MDCETVLATATKRKWDVAIVGSGMGGGTAAYAFARAGMSVLILERGLSHLTNPEAIFHELGERILQSRNEEERRDVLKNAGRLWNVVADVTQPRARLFRPYVGNCVGGSSSLFGMALERFRPQDFVPGQFFADAPDANVPAEWPIRYSELEPYYREAERLYRVRGTPDPLGPKGTSYEYLAPPPLSPSNVEVARLLTANGLHPYYQPIACEYRDGCRECPGHICATGCKNSSYMCCIEPAIREFGAVMLDHCDVTYLEADGTKVRAIHCTYRGVPGIIKAEIVVLAGGALQTPALLLKSQNAIWPYGLANRHDQVGRNLMRHFIDYYFVRPTRGWRPGELAKQVAFNDFYVSAGTKLGTVQSVGPTPPPEKAGTFFEMGLTQNWPWMAPILRMTRPVTEPLVQRVMQGALLWASILEDLPYSANRVTYDRARSQIGISYRLQEEGWRRIRRFRALCLNAFSPLSVRLWKQAHNSSILAHQVGTCRIGTSHESSVLDRNCRAHEMDNLFVVDGSFMPTSGGINPSLTIAANALRVAAICTGTSLTKQQPEVRMAATEHPRR